METFIYNDDNFTFNVPCSNTYSLFDIKLRSKWDEKQDEGVFRYRLNITKEKYIADKFYLQLNVDRALNRRPPSDIQSINQPFDPSAFNFTKIKDDEKLFYISHESKTNDVNKHVIAINVSPLEYGHVLLMPNLEEKLPQILTEDALKLAIEMILLSSSSYFRVGFNSLGAYASVNHLHFHGYYLQRCMYLEKAPVEVISYPCHRVLNFPSKGFVFQIRTIEEIDDIVGNIYKLVQFLQSSNIPHNLYITRGSTFELIKEDDKTRNCLRIYVWPRKPSFGAKDLSSLNAATCELFGHLVIKNEKDFNSLNADDVVNILEDLTSQEFANVMKNIFRIFPA